MKKDIHSKEDIKKLVDEFYAHIKVDNLLGPIFTDITKVDWASHLPNMYSFWENILFYSGGYNGNPLITHQRIHTLFPLTSSHFDRWEVIFINTVDAIFEGEKAILAKTRAMQISKVLQDKLARVDKLQNLFD